MITKELTPSQQLHLAVLIERAAAARQDIDAFLDYLRDEHSTPATEGWRLMDLQTGFVKPEQPEAKG